MTNSHEIRLVIDLGGSKTSAMVAANTEHGVSLLAMSQQQTRGVQNGSIVHLAEVKQTIMSAIKEIDQQSGLNFSKATVSVPAEQARIHYVTVQQSFSNQTITKKLLRKFLLDNLSKYCPVDSEIIHHFVTNYEVGELKDVVNPIGMVANQLCANLTIITATKSFIANIEQCLAACNLELEHLVLAPLASLLNFERQYSNYNTCLLIELGHSSTTLMGVEAGKICYFATLPIAGQQITKDLALCLKISANQADRLKMLYSNLMPAALESSEEICLMPEAAHEEDDYVVSRSLINQIIVARMDELLDMIKERLTKDRQRHLLNSRLVLSGGSADILGTTQYFSQHTSSEIIINLPPVNNIPTKYRYASFASLFGLLNYMPPRLSGVAAETQKWGRKILSWWNKWK